VGLNVVMYFSRLLPSGLGGRYLFSFLPMKADKIVWQDGETKEFKVWIRNGHYAARVPVVTRGSLLWLKANRLVEEAVRKWETPIDSGKALKAKLNGASYFVLLLPPEARERTVEGQRLVWVPKEFLARLLVAFQGLIHMRETLMHIGEGSPVPRVEGFMILDETEPVGDMRRK